MRVLVMNERATPRMRRNRVRRDFETALSLRPTAVLWQELVRFPYYVKLLRTVFNPADGWVHYFTSRKNPVSIRKRERWVVIEVRRHRLTRGFAGIPQPARFTTVVVLRNMVTGVTIALVNSHFTNGAFLRLRALLRRGRTLLNRKRRRTLWEKQHDRTSEVVADLYARGISCIGGGDLNSGHPGKFHRHQKWVAHDGVMWAWTLEAPGGAEISVEDTHVIGTDRLETDHAALLLDLHLVRPDR